jgi:hypothetical protein
MMIDRLNDRLKERSAALLLSIDSRLDRIIQWWLVLAALASVSRMTMTPHAFPVASWPTFASYLMLVVAPAVSTVLALRWFSNGHLQPQPKTRLALMGRWSRVSRSEAERHPLYGAGGIMVSLLVGVMLNVPVRAAEYLAAMPPLPIAAPRWLSALHFAMTFDAVLFTSLYMVAFVAALRRVPLFPRLIVAIWLSDLTMQLITAQLVTAAGPIPTAVSAALQGLLIGNVKKVLISMSLWLPYLLLSKRVNVTYRHRVPA